MTINIGTPNSINSTKALILGSGELAKELVIELHRFGVETIAVDRYDNAPAMQVSHKKYVLDMLNSSKLFKLIELEKPNFIIPEIEAINTDTLMEIEKKGFNVIPNASAVFKTMNRERIRNLASEKLNLPTSNYLFADSYEELKISVKNIGMPCFIKPIMSSSGKGQSLVNNESEIRKAWDFAQSYGRAGKGKVIIESLIDFNDEITLLTIKSENNIVFCPPIGHIQKDGDYIESWQPHSLPKSTLIKCKKIAEKIVSELGGNGIFGVELFIKDNEVYFSEVSPRPHDTGMVTLISQDLSEFSLHVRAILNLGIPEEINAKPSASVVIKGDGKSEDIKFIIEKNILSETELSFKLFGKPSISGSRRLGVVLASSKTTKDALKKAKNLRDKISLEY